MVIKQLHVSTIASQYWCAIKMIMRFFRPDISPDNQYISRGNFFNDMFGFGKGETVKCTMNGYEIIGTPDAVGKEHVMEFKTLNNKNHFKYVLYPAISQANIYATMMMKPKYYVVIATVQGEQIVKIWNSSRLQTFPDKATRDILSAIDLVEEKKEPIPPQPFKCYACDMKYDCRYFKENVQGKHTKYLPSDQYQDQHQNIKQNQQ